MQYSTKDIGIHEWISTNLRIFQQQGEIPKEALASIPLQQLVDRDSQQWQSLSVLPYNEDSDLLISQSLQFMKSELRWGTFIMFLSVQCSNFLCLLLYYIFLNIASKQFTSTPNLILISISITIKLLKPFLSLLSDKKLKSLGIKLHRCICEAIIQKTLQSSLSSNSNVLTFANMSKLIHVDIEKILTYPHKIAYVRVNVFSVLYLFAVLFLLLGWSGFVACSIYIFVFLVNLVHKFKNDRLEQELVTVRDQRLKATIQTLAIIKFIKVNALEQYIFDKISALRIKEFDTLQELFKMDIWRVFYYMGLSKIFLPTVLLSLALLHYDIGTAIYNCLYTIFFNIFIFRIAKQISLIKEAELCIENISKLLSLQLESRSYISHQIFKQPSFEQNAIQVKGSFYWQNKIINQQKSSRRAFQLSNVQFSIKKGLFSAVSGVYGSGKTSLLQCILGQMKANIGSQIKLYGKIGYVSQKPWIMNETIRNNILFGSQFHQKRYKDALYYSGLMQDISMLHLGDHTLIGQRGCTISGGQKVRIALARVIYSDADTFLLDDIFSAMDIHVGTFLFEQTLKKFLKGKTILLVTHNIQFAKQSDLFYLIRNGQIILQDNPKISNPKPLYSSDLRQQLHLTQPPQQIHQPYQRRLKQGLSIYHNRNGGTYFIANTIVVLILILALIIFYYQWNNYWAVAKDKLQAKFIIISYALCLITGIVFVFYGLVLYGSPLYSYLHRDMLQALLQAPPYYFEITSSAMITSRVSSDLQICDKVLGSQYYLSQANIGTMLGQIFTFLLLNIKLNNIYLFFIFALYIVSLFYFCKKYAVATIYFYTQKQQHKIPLKFIYEQTLQGLSTIRSLGKSQYQQQQYMDKADQYLKTTLVYDTLQSYLNFSIGFISSLYFCSILIFHLFIEYDDIYSNIFIASIIVNEEFLYRISLGVTEFMFKLESLIKCEELAAIESEKHTQSIVVQDTQNTLQSPFSIHLFASGGIIFKEVSLRYSSNLHTVVQNISFSIKAKQKIGIVGRTGSGKSTLLLSILKMVEVSSGTIEIDGQDLAYLVPTHVRRQVNTILQDHFLFTGTVQENIDPTSDHSDEELIQILQEVGLWHKFKNQQGLQTPINENGMNLSAGERQLLNISRALLKPKAIVLVDQATASIDSQTDRLIQKVMRERIFDSTVLTVAHRISTILQSDRIMVLQNGKICEFDSPTILLGNKNSLFYSLLQQLQTRKNQRQPQIQRV